MTFPLSLLAAISPKEEEDEEEFQLPDGNTPGRLFVEVLTVYPKNLRPHSWMPYEIDRTSYDADTAAYWINEGIGVDHFFYDCIDVDQPGIYVVEGVTVSWSKDYYGEVDEDHEFTLVRYATEEEIKEL